MVYSYWSMEQLYTLSIVLCWLYVRSINNQFKNSRYEWRKYLSANTKPFGPQRWCKVKWQHHISSETYIIIPYHPSTQKGRHADILSYEPSSSSLTIRAVERIIGCNSVHLAGAVVATARTSSLWMLYHYCKPSLNICYYLMSYG